ncbi:hypothetical protein C8J57DRAFT_1679658 [Mycena rebaudengoi]|nr:hypothetical protein C8J57DRAFT_1679658 [Mycena rebaudengoi]
MQEHLNKREKRLLNASGDNDRQTASSTRTPQKKTASSPAESPMTEMPACPMSDKASLGNTIKECFAELTKGNEVQTERVLNALKPKAPPATDKETTFWNAYKTLSEEYDREFHKKYGTDLDTSLIFIQPELQQDPNEVTQQLLRVLIHNANQSLFSGIDLAEPNNGAPTTVVVVQSLLYASLFSTLLAALLAVLGKQWLMHYDATGSRGILAECGLECQRKYDGLQKWKFTLIMEMFPLLLQLALLLFSAALDIPGCSGIHFSVGLSHCVSRFTVPDSTFQCFAQTVLPFVQTGHKIMEDTTSFTTISSPVSEGSASPAVPAVLWLLETSTNPDVISAAADIAADLQWPLDADLGLALHRLHTTFWACFIKHKGSTSERHQFLIPLKAQDTQSLQLTQLHTVFKALKGDTLCLQTVRTQSDMLWVFHVLPRTFWGSVNFASMKSMLDYALSSQTGITKQSYADCLLLLNIILGFPAHPDTLMLKDKSFAIDFLVEELFKNLRNCLDKRLIHLTTAKGIITTVNQMTNIVAYKLDTRESKSSVRQYVYHLGATIAHLNGWVDVVVAALAFGDLSGHALLEDVSWVYTVLQDVEPSSDSIEEDWDTTTEERVLQLLKALNDTRDFPAPSKEVLQVILAALYTEGPCSIQALQHLCQVKNWFTDNDLEPTMQEHNVWSRMGVVIMKNSSQILDHSVRQYILLGEELSRLTQWAPYIRRNPSHWITIYSWMVPHKQWQLQTEYLSVLEHIWGVKYTGTYQLTKDTEKNLRWTLTAVSVVWEGFDFSGQQTLQDFYPLIRCTLSTVFKAQYRWYLIFHSSVRDILISPNLRATFYAPLGDSLILAAKKATDMNSDDPGKIGNQQDLDVSPQEKTQVLQQAATILDKMGQALKLESEGEQVDRGEERARQYWDNLRTHFEEQVDQLEESVKETPGTAVSH